MTELLMAYSVVVDKLFCLLLMVNPYWNGVNILVNHKCGT